MYRKVFKKDTRSNAVVVLGKNMYTFLYIIIICLKAQSSLGFLYL